MGSTVCSGWRRTVRLATAAERLPWGLPGRVYWRPAPRRGARFPRSAPTPVTSKVTAPPDFSRLDLRRDREAAPPSANRARWVLTSAPPQKDARGTTPQKEGLYEAITRLVLPTGSCDGLPIAVGGHRPVAPVAGQHSQSSAGRVEPDHFRRDYAPRQHRRQWPRRPA